MINNVLNINKRKGQFFKYSICMGISLFSILMFNITSVLAGPVDEDKIPIPEDYYSVANAENNALQSMGIRDYDTVKNHVDFYTPDGEIATRSYLEEVADKPNMNEYLVVKYKDDEESQKIGKVFGTNGAALQEYLDTQGSDYKKNLDKLINIQEQMIGATTQLVTVDGQQGIQFDSATGLLIITKDVDLTKIINKGDADLLEDLRQQWKELTGIDDLFSMSEGDIEAIISKMDRAEDVNMKLTANKQVYYVITKVRFKITNKDTGAPVTNASVDNATTSQLFAKYNSKWISKYRTMTGNSIPPLTPIGNGVYEMDFGQPIYAMEDKWTKILKNWTSDSNASDFLGVGAFTIAPSSNPLQVKVEILGDRLEYYENVDSQGTYPTGKRGKQSNNPAEYTFKNFNDSFYYDSYIHSVDYYTGVPTYINGYKLLNQDISIKEGVYYTYPWASRTYTDENGETKTYWYRQTIENPCFTKQVNGAKYKGNEINETGDRPLYSVDDGEHVRDIWFKTQYVKYWDYKEDLLINSEAYSDAPYVVSKKARSSVGDEKPLVRFANEDARIKGKALTKEKASGWLPPKTITSMTLTSATWNLAPLDGKIQIPVMTKTGTLEGVINEADINIR